MSGDNPHKTTCCCPLCKAINAYHESTTAKHLRGIQREVLMATKSGIDIWIRHIDKQECPVRESKEQSCD